LVLPLLGSVGTAAAAEKLSELEPMEALKDKDYGKPRMKWVRLRRHVGLQWHMRPVSGGCAGSKR
jgi:hypothetical protein